MSIFDLLGFKRRRCPSTDLVGKWRLVKSEGETLYEEDSEMVFAADGKLSYSIPDKDTGRIAIMNLLYKAQGDYLITDQPSSPREEKTAFMFETKDTLVLKHGGTTAWFERV